MAAPDFFFAVNATFRHILDTYGEEALHRYWQEMGREHYAHVTRAIQQHGLYGLAEHWRQLFAEEPGSDVQIKLGDDLLVLTVKTCPAILHLTRHHREILDRYCDHCFYVSRGMCEPAGVSVSVSGGGGSCVQTFTLLRPSKEDQT